MQKSLDQKFASIHRGSISADDFIVADPAGADDQLLYFTSSSITADDRTVILIREIDGNPNLFACDLKTGDTRALTNNTDGYLKSYVYFDGQPNAGFGKASVSLDPRSGQIYYIQGNEIRRADLSGNEQTLANVPDDEATAFTHVSSDGHLLCVPTTDARALAGPFRDNKPEYDIDARVRDENLCSYLNIYDSQSGQRIAREVVRNAWITHVQFCPTNPRLILYNHEWPSDCGVRRVWLWDGKSHRPLRSESRERSRGDWVCHEMWARDGKSIIYHGRYAGTDPVTTGRQLIFGAGNGASFIGRCDADGSDLLEIALPTQYTRYGHFTVGNDGWLVTDGYFEQPDDPPGPGTWIALLRPDWNARTIEWKPICRHGSSWKSQDEHPHPIFDHAGRSVLFTSDRSGRRRVYQIKVC